MRVLRSLLLVATILTLASLPASAVEVPLIGSYEAIQTLAAATTISCGNASRHRTIRVVGSGGPVTLTSDPQIAAGTSAGQLCDITGTSDTDTVTISHGAGVQLWKAAGSVTLGLLRNRVLPVVWTGTLWAQRGPIQDSAQDYTISPPSDTDVVLNPTGTGLAKVGTAKIVTEPVLMSSGSTTWDGTFTACDVGDPCTFVGSTLERREYENGGVWVSGIFEISSGDQQPTILNIPATLTDEIQGNSVPISTDDGSTAQRTVHAPVNHCVEDGVGADDAYTCNFTPALDRYADGAVYSFEATVANTTGATLNINGLGALPILRLSGGTLSALATGDIVAGQKVIVQYDGANLQMQSTPGTVTGGAYTDEQAQDAVGAMVDASLTYVDATPLLQRAALTGDVTASAGSNATTVANNAITNAKLADVPTQTFKGRTTAATGDPEDLTISQANTMLIGNAFFAVAGPATSIKTYTFPNASSTVLTTNAAVTVAQGGTGLTTGTSGGVPYYSATGVLSSSAALTANAVLVGGGAGVAPTPLASLGTSGHVLTSNGAGTPPSFQASTGGATGAMLPPIRPYTMVPVTAGTTFGWVHVSPAGTDDRQRREGMGVAASLVADADWELGFDMPPTLATGCTYKLRLKGQSAGTGNAQVTPIWASVAVDENPSAVNHISEGTTQIAFAAADLYEISDITLDADTLVGGEEVSMILRFESTSWTLNGISVWSASIICN